MTNPEDTATAPASRQSVVRGISWVGGGRMLVRSLGVLSTLVLARLLAPEDFGLVALAMAVIAFLESATHLNFSHALIHYRDASDEDYATAWTLGLGRGVLLAAAALTAAYPISLVTGEPRVVPLLAALALIPILHSLESPRFVVHEKRMRFRPLFWLMTATKVVGVIVAVTVAVLWRSYWALAAGMLATGLVRPLLTFAMAPGSVWLTTRSWRKLLRFTGWLSGAEVLGSVANRLDPLLLGMFVSTQIVGFLHMARELTWTTFNEIAAPLRRVLFPALSQYQATSGRFRTAYSEAVAGLFMVLAPIMAGMALTAPNAVPLLLGAQWSTVIQPMQLLCTGLVFSIPSRVAQSAVMASGETRLIFFRALILLPVKLAAFVGGAYWLGLIGAVIGATVAMMVETVVNVEMGRRVTGVSIVGHFRLAGRSWIALVAMVGVVIAVTSFTGVPAATGERAVALLAQVLTGATVYIAVHLLAWRWAGRPPGPESVVLDIGRRGRARLAL